MTTAVRQTVVGTEEQKNLLTKRYDVFARLSCGHRVKLGRKSRSIGICGMQMACHVCEERT